jgi:hypothetical protein
VVDFPGAIAAAVRNRLKERILQSAAFERRIDARMRNSPREIRGKDWAFSGTYQRQSLS